MNEIDVTVVGNVVSDVRHVLVADGTPVASFRVASTSRRFNKEIQAFVDGEVTYLTVTTWRRLADHCALSLTKGDPVVVFGRLRLRPWEKDERRGMSVEVEASAVGHDLTRGTTEFTRARRGPSLPDTEARSEADAMAALAEAQAWVEGTVGTVGPADEASSTDAA
jgi:single-strand DNA-binding protein